MMRDGLRVAGFDGRAPQAGGWNRLPVPLVYAGVRPDVWGVALDEPTLALGEAKTRGDIDNEHTRRQLRVFGALRVRGEQKLCTLYVATLSSSACVMDAVLRELGLLGASHVVRLYMPDCMIHAPWRLEGSECYDT